MRRPFFYLCILLTTALFTGCTGGFSAIETGSSSKPVSKPAGTLSSRSFVPDESAVLPLGRTFFDENNLRWCAYSGTGAAFVVHGTSASVTLVGDGVSTAGKSSHYARVAVFVNGERVVDAQLSNKEQTFPIFSYDAPQEAEVRIVKLSESAMSTFAIKEISVEAVEDIRPAAQKSALIEFVGDSITCGYGVDDADKDHDFSTATEDVTKTYAWKAAAALNADCSVVAISGYGVVSGYTSDAARPKEVMPSFYENYGDSQGRFGTVSPATIDWDFSGREPDIIVIQLGTNDNTYCKGIPSREQEFVSAYHAFLKTIRSHNPNARILCTLGILGSELYPSIQQAMTAYTAETGDKKISALEFDLQAEEDGYAVDWHPTEATHEKASKKLIAALRQWLPG